MTGYRKALGRLLAPGGLNPRLSRPLAGFVEFDEATFRAGAAEAERPRHAAGLLGSLVYRPMVFHRAVGSGALLRAGAPPRARYRGRVQAPCRGACRRVGTGTPTISRRWGKRTGTARRRHAALPAPSPSPLPLPRVCRSAPSPTPASAPGLRRGRLGEGWGNRSPIPHFIPPLRGR
jgi:hypothetical protein